MIEKRTVELHTETQLDTETCKERGFTWARAPKGYVRDDNHLLLLREPDLLIWCSIIEYERTQRVDASKELPNDPTIRMYYGEHGERIYLREVRGIRHEPVQFDDLPIATGVWTVPS